MKVLVFNRVSDTPELNLYVNLKRAGVNLHLILDPKDPGFEKYQAAGIPFHKLEVANRFDLSAIKLVKKLHKEENFDVIYAPASRNLSTTLFATLGKKVKILTYRGTIGRLSLFSPLSWITHLNPKVSAIVCNCQAVKDSLLTLSLKEEKLPVVYKGHNPEWYADDASLNLNLPANTIIMSCIANIRKKKGIDILLKAVALLPQDLRFCLLIAGSLEDSRIVKMAKDLNINNKVRFIGFIKTPGALLAKTDFVVVPSLAREGVPRSMMEAMSLGIPAIATRVGGIPEILINQENGILLEPGDEVSLAKAIEKFCRDPEARNLMAKNAALRIKEKFNPDLHAEGFLKIFQNLLKE